MDRRLFALITVALIFGAGASAMRAQGDPGPPGLRRRWPIGDRGLPGGFAPGDRQRFRMNAERWLGMLPAEQQFLRQRAMIRRERMRHEAEAAFNQSGLRLDEQRRQQYEVRYFEERKKLEQALRQDLQEKRKQQLPPMLDRLKKEFEPQQLRPSASVSPTAAPAKRP